MTPPRDMVGKALTLLTHVGDYPDGAVASELARRSELPLSTAHRLLGALVRDGYAEFDASSKRYTLGLRVFQLGQRVAQARGFAGMTRPVLEQVSRVTREATLLAVLDGEQQMYVHSVGGPQQVSVVGEPGRHGPLHCTSQGKVLVAFAPEDVRARLVETVALEPTGPNAITSRRAFREEVDAVRARGYAIADEEHEAGIRAIGVPVFGGRHAVAALATAAPAYRTGVDGLVQHLPTLREASEALAAVMPSG